MIGFFAEVVCFSFTYFLYWFSAMKKLFSGIFLAASIALLSPTLVQAEQINKITTEKLASILQSEGYSGIKNEADNAVSVKVNGSTYIFFVADDGDLQGYYGISKAKVSLGAINNWNATRRLSRAYLDKENEPAIEADLLSDGGLTDKNITSFIRVFLLSADSFKKYIRENLDK